MTTELGAERGVDLGSERLIIARSEPGKESGGDHGYRNVFGDRLRDRPASLT